MKIYITGSAGAGKSTFAKKLQKELRDKYSLIQTFRLIFTTILDKNKKDGIDIRTDIPGHYKEKDRLNLCNINSKNMIVIKG